MNKLNTMSFLESVTINIILIDSILKAFVFLTILEICRAEEAACVFLFLNAATHPPIEDGSHAALFTPTHVARSGAKLKGWSRITS